jgi:hypothetical protein
MKNSAILKSLKFVVITGFLISLNFNAQAQSSKEEIDLMQAAFGMQKKDMISGFLQIPADNAFWAIYDQYETERKELGKKRIELILKYSENYANLSDVDIDAYMKDMMSLKKSHDKLIDTYYAKVKKASGSKIAAQFYEFENYILSAIRLEIMNNIPFFGELDN